MNYKLHKTIVTTIKKTFGIHSLKLFVRKKQLQVERLFYHKKYTAHELVDELVRMGMKPGSVVIVHCAMNNFYNYRGTVDELIDELLRALGPEGTLCMPAFPYDKYDTDRVFDVRTEKTAAGLLAETFRKRPGVKRSLNQLHSVCAFGPKADCIVGEHHLSRTCFDRHSPFYKIYEFGGQSICLGLPDYFLGTCAHISESLLRDELAYFQDKFTIPVTFHYIDQDGNSLTHTMLTKSKKPYIRQRSKKFIDDNFDHSKYAIKRFSNLWINVYDVREMVDTLTRLAREGKTIYSYPKFYR
ncbi:MAG: AAC(3) family N-acetyltransferase [Bacteroidaceae bacterium]|nr:AAC(3) family N-acetyltransferase [Bacteroidaceae bacterium]